MPQMRQCTISYFRANWGPRGSPGLTLENALDTCLQNLPNVAETRVSLGTYLVETRHRHIDQTGIRIHVAAWIHGVEALIVPPVTHGSDADLESKPPPPGTNYLDGDGMVFVSGNHCLLLPSGLSIQPIQDYIRRLLARGRKHRPEIPEDKKEFKFETIVRSDVVRQIEDEGIKGINLSLAEYLETMRSRSDSKPRTILQKLGTDLVMDFVSKDEDLEFIEIADNVHTRLVIRMLGNSRAAVGPVDRQALAGHFAGDSIDKIELVTGRGRRIKHKDMAVQKTITLDAFAKTVHHQSAWDEMDKYFQELSSSGGLAS